MAQPQPPGWYRDPTGTYTYRYWDGSNTDGDGQKALDIIADEAFASALKGTGIRWYASEEQEEVVGIDAGRRRLLRRDRACPRSDDDTGLVSAQNGDGVSAPETLYGLAHGSEQIVAALDRGRLDHLDGRQFGEFLQLVDHDDADREFDYVTGAEEILSAAQTHGWAIVSIKSDWRQVFPG